MSDWPPEPKRASEHDPFCHAAKLDYHDPECCECEALALARADERAKILEGIKAMEIPMDEDDEFRAGYFFGAMVAINVVQGQQ